jgi:membrane protease YdiL (CAAX protease family)
MKSPDRRSEGLVQMAAWMYGLMTLGALVWGGLRGLHEGWWTFSGWMDVPPAVALALALGLMSVWFSQQLDNRVAGIRKLGDRFASILGGVTTREAIQLAALSSVGEELLFRGCMQQEWGIWPATILFAIVHTGPQRVFLWWTASAFVFGLLLALLYEHQGGLLAPILMHFTINAFNIRFLGKRGKLPGKDRLEYDF